MNKKTDLQTDWWGGNKKWQLHDMLVHTRLSSPRIRTAAAADGRKRTMRRSRSVEHCARIVCEGRLGYKHN